LAIGSRGWVNQLVTNALMIPLCMVVGDELRNRASQMPFPEQDHALEARFLDRPNESLRVRIAVRCTERRPNDSHTFVFNEFQYATAPLAMAIADQFASLYQDAINRIRQVAHGLHDERFIWVRVESCHTNAPRLQLENEQRGVRHQSASGLELGREKSATTRADQCARGNVRQLLGRSQLGGTPSAFRMLAIVDRATRWPTFFSPLNARVDPARILCPHPHDQTPNLGEHSRSAWSPPGVRPFPRNQFPMPSKNRVRRDERRHLSEDSASEPLPEHRKTPTLLIVQLQPPSGQLCFQRAILLAKERDHIALLPLEPSE